MDNTTPRNKQTLEQRRQARRHKELRDAYARQLPHATVAWLLDQLETCARVAKYGSHDEQRGMLRAELERRTHLPRIDVVVSRHPDYENDVTTYVNGVPTEVYEWSFDPGAGYEYSDYCEMRDGDIAQAPDFLKPVIARTYNELRRAYEKWSTDDEPWPATDNNAS